MPEINTVDLPAHESLLICQLFSLEEIAGTGKNNQFLRLSSGASRRTPVVSRRAALRWNIDRGAVNFSGSHALPLANGDSILPGAGVCCSKSSAQSGRQCAG